MQLEASGSAQQDFSGPSSQRRLLLHLVVRARAHDDSPALSVARTTDTPVAIHMSGFGPTDTRYCNPADDPASSHKP